MNTVMRSKLGGTACEAAQFAGSAPGGSVHTKLTTLWHVVLFGSAPVGDVQNATNPEATSIVQRAPTPLATGWQVTLRVQDVAVAPQPSA